MPVKKNEMPHKEGEAQRDRLLEEYQMMLLVRRFEERAGQVYGMQLIGGFCHLYIGQEAVVVGIQGCLGPEDCVVAAYRDHGHMLACGMEPKRVMAELMGRRDGYSKGKGGSMHMFSREKNFYGGHGIVGATGPLGCGLAFALKYRQSGGLCVAYTGDGAMNQGQMYEAFNMASLWSLPVLYVIENNAYAMGTSIERASASGKDLFQRAAPLGIPGESADGMDLLAVREAAQRGTEFCRSGQGPYILELKTYRYRGHSMSDPAQYRSREEVEQVKATRDPLEHVERLLEEQGMTKQALKEEDKRIRARVSEAVEFAKKSPEPDLSEIWTDVLVQEHRRDS